MGELHSWRWSEEIKGKEEMVKSRRGRGGTPENSKKSKMLTACLMTVILRDNKLSIVTAHFFFLCFCHTMSVLPSERNELKNRKRTKRRRWRRRRPSLPSLSVSSSRLRGVLRDLKILRTKRMEASAITGEIESFSIFCFCFRVIGLLRGVSMIVLIIDMV